VVVEGGDLVHLGARQLHQLRQRGEALGVEMAVRVLDAVQAFDQQVAAHVLCLLCSNPYAAAPCRAFGRNVASARDVHVTQAEHPKAN
jgi:hypothetical protein